MSNDRGLFEIVDSLRGLAPVGELGLEQTELSKRFALVRDFVRSEPEREVPELWLARAGALALPSTTAAF
ncbi:hypothetical protein EON81_18800 [bacterium]|nr:MAG: hypothetical protein EON81_18800 [bacterium]